jgi:hypothetical protein
VLIGLSGHPKVRIFTRNISTGGLGFLTYREFHKGEYVVLPLGLPGGRTKLCFVLAQFVRYISGGLYEVGVEFLAANDVEPKAPYSVPHEWIMTARSSSLAKQPVHT